jgi:putative lumazine-binding protein
MTVTSEATAPAAGPSGDEVAAVRATVLDYFEGWFDGDVARMERALHPLLAKRSRGQDAHALPVLQTTTTEQMLWFTREGNGRTTDPARRQMEVRIVEVSGGIATAIVHSYMYVEYIHLVATPDGWRIVNCLWRYADGRNPFA